MRKMIMTALATGIVLPSLAIPTLASAQSAREVRQDQREVRQDVRRGDYKEAREDRKEMREDWRDYRKAHRDTFRRPGYVGPRGYVYRPVVVGHRFDRVYYGNRYWVRDYARYRLPAPGYNNRWVRYGNDVVLINIRTGRVVRVYNGFFF